MKMKKKGYAKGGMKSKGYAKGGMKPDFLDLDKDGDKKEPMKSAAKGMRKGGMTKKGYAKGGMLKKKAYAKGGKVAMYNQGGMVKNTGKLNTGIKTAKNTYK